jgi:hypothetical protein
MQDHYNRGCTLWVAFLIWVGRLPENTSSTPEYSLTHVKEEEVDIKGVASDFI